MYFNYLYFNYFTTLFTHDVRLSPSSASCHRPKKTTYEHSYDV